MPISLWVQILKGETHIPTCLSPGAQNLIRRILDPNPKTRINEAEIKADDWFKQDYTPAIPNDDEEDIISVDEPFSIKEVLENVKCISFLVLVLNTLI